MNNGGESKLTHDDSGGGRNDGEYPIEVSERQSDQKSLDGDLAELHLGVMPLGV